MIELVITSRLHRGIFAGLNSPRLFSMRPLSRHETMLMRRLGICRYYLPSLNEIESAEFFSEFDCFWNQLISPFDQDHPFWRNAVSSKMQEWENSASYLALALFTLAKRSKKDSLRIVILCASIEEENVCKEWGEQRGWKICRKSHLLLPCWLRRLLQNLQNFRVFIFLFSLCMYRKWFSPEYKPAAPVTSKQILISSLFYLRSFRDGKYTDPFFGKLHDIIQQNGYSVTYLCNPLEKFRKSAMNTRGCSNVSIVIPYSVISWIELIFLVLKVFVRRVQVTQANFLGCNFSKLIEWNVCRFYGFFNFDAEIYYAAIRKLCKKENYIKLIQLYEGNVFERGCVQAFRKYNSSVIVGYSHGVIYPLNLKIRMTDNERRSRPEPDFFVCTGSENKRLFAQIGNREPSIIYPGCSLRHIANVNRTEIEEGNQSNILVALDGVKSSIIVLDWLIENAEDLKNYKIKLRAHPNVPLNGLLRQCLRNPPDNFYSSEGNLEDEIKSSFCVLYRQTSVGMQALLNGVPAIHLNVDAPLISDPIMTVNAYKWRVQTSEELLRTIQKIHALDYGKRKDLICDARENVKNYFTGPDNVNILPFYADSNTS